LTLHGDQEPDFTAASFAAFPLGIGANPPDLYHPKCGCSQAD
jgi:hypothetical protein